MKSKRAGRPKLPDGDRLDSTIKFRVNKTQKERFSKIGAKKMRAIIEFYKQPGE